ncbi:jg23286, partial [Pararge aegeria aegeria]
PPSFRTRPHNIEAEEDSSVTLSCDVDGEPRPEIRWLYHEPGRIGVKGKAPNLKVYVDQRTAGRYICKATVEGYPEIESEATIFIKGMWSTNPPHRASVVDYGLNTLTVDGDPCLMLMMNIIYHKLSLRQEPC